MMVNDLCYESVGVTTDWYFPGFLIIFAGGWDGLFMESLRQLFLIKIVIIRLNRHFFWRFRRIIMLRGGGCGGSGGVVSLHHLVCHLIGYMAQFILELKQLLF